MKNISGTDHESAQNQKNGKNKSGKVKNNFVVGLVTFIIFVLFMAMWMYFST